MLPAGDVDRNLPPEQASLWPAWFAALIEEGRAVEARYADGPRGLGRNRARPAGDGGLPGCNLPPGAASLSAGRGSPDDGRC